LGVRIDNLQVEIPEIPELYKKEDIDPVVPGASIRVGKILVDDSGIGDVCQQKALPWYW
jgi:hypothetical protein